MKEKQYSTYKKILAFVMSVSLLFILQGIAFAEFKGNEIEPNNSYENANDFVLNSLVSGTLSTGSDKDIYKIIVPSNGKLTISFNHNYTDKGSVEWHICVYQYTNGEYKKLIGNLIYGTANELINLPVIGTEATNIYYVEISGNKYLSDANGLKYTVINSFSSTELFEKELNNSYDTATLLNFNTACGGCLLNSDDIDYFRINTSKGGKIKLSFYHPYIENSEAQWKIEVIQYINGSYNKILTKSIYMNSNETIMLNTIDVIENGVYYVKINNGNSYISATPTGKEYNLANTFKEYGSNSSGDINGDGIIDAGDAVLVQRYDAGLFTLTADQLAAADVTGDGIVDAGDAVKIQRYDAGLITEL